MYCTHSHHTVSNFGVHICNATAKVSWLSLSRLFPCLSYCSKKDDFPQQCNQVHDLFMTKENREGHRFHQYRNLKTPFSVDNMRRKK